MIAQNIQRATIGTGIFFVGERSELIRAASAELEKLGYSLPVSDIADAGFFSALDKWRASKRLPTYDFVDPLSLRLLTGIEVGGDELVLLASCAETLPTLSERYRLCREAVAGTKEMMVILTKYLAGRFNLGSLPIPSADSGRCAVIAKLIT